MAIYKKCSKCGKKIEQYQECACMVQEKKDSYKRYKERRRMDKEEKIRQDFYSSSDWLRIRASAIADCYGLDITLWCRDGTIALGQVAHHIIELKEDWNSRLDVSNIIYVTEQTHKIIHTEYNKGERQKKAMQKLLFSLIDRFNKEFKGGE